MDVSVKSLVSEKEIGNIKKNLMRRFTPLEDPIAYHKYVFSFLFLSFAISFVVYQFYRICAYSILLLVCKLDSLQALLWDFFFSGIYTNRDAKGGKGAKTNDPILATASASRRRSFDSPRRWE